jgi:hypothetical protein
MKLIARTVQGYRRRRATRRKRMGMRKRRVIRRRVPIQNIGMRKKRRVMRGGFLGNILRGINQVARSVPIVSTALRATGNPLAGSVAGALGYRRHRKRRMGGFMGVIPLAMRGRRRTRRVRRGGFKRKGFVSFGGFKRRGYVSFGGLRRAPRRRLIQPTRIGRPGMMGMRRRRTQRGRGLMDVLRKVHNFAKDNKLISKGLSLIPHKYAQAAAPIASSLGYRRRRTRRMGGRRIKMGRYLPNVSYF